VKQEISFYRAITRRRFFLNTAGPPSARDADGKHGGAHDGWCGGPVRRILRTVCLSPTPSAAVRLSAPQLVTAASYSRILGAKTIASASAPIGTGQRGQALYGALNQIGSNDIVALCDVYKPHLITAKAAHAPNADEYGDHRAVLDRKDVDAVIISTPDTGTCAF